MRFLKRYLQAWMVILSQGKFREILYIDGFAGPGEYENGQVGSPIIALQNALNYRPPLTATCTSCLWKKTQQGQHT